MTNENTPSPQILAKLDEMNSWRTEREKEYGVMQVQLNMLFDDIEAGKFGETAKTGSWYLHIKSVKDSITKPDMDTLQSELNALFAEQD